MTSNEILESIPNKIASLFENIYVLNEQENTFVHVLYNGEKLAVSSPKSKEELLVKFKEFNEETIQNILHAKELKKSVFTKNNEEKLITVLSQEQYKLIFIMDLVYQREVSDKPILIIADDSPIITNFFTKIFRDQYEILVAKDGNEAIDLVEENMDQTIAGAFLDLQMPNKNGYEVLDYFKENDLFKKIPVSVITGEDSAEGIEKTTSYEIVDMLQKPFGKEAATAIVNKTVQHKENK